MTLSLELEVAGLVHQGLFFAHGDLVGRYNSALEKIIGRRTALTEFRLDKRGESPELEAELGANYLQIGPANRYMIIVSPEQKAAPLIHAETTYDNMIVDAVYRNAANTILDVTASEALYGELDTKIDLYTSIDDLLLLNSVEVQLETPVGTLEKIHDLKKMSITLHEHLLDDEYIARMLALQAEVGDIRHRSVSCVRVRKEVGSFFTRFFDGVWVLREVKDGRSRKTLMIHSDARAEEENGKILYRNVLDPALPDLLFRLDLIKYDLAHLPRRMHEAETRALLDRNVDVGALDEVGRKTAMQRARLPAYWSELRTLERAAKGGRRSLGSDLAGLSPEAKWALASPAAADADVVNTLLCRQYIHDWRRTCQYNHRDLERVFPTLNDASRRYIISLLTSSEEKPKRKR